MKLMYLTAAVVISAVTLAAQTNTDRPLPPGDNPPPTVFDRIKNAGTAKDFDSAAYAIVCDSTVNTVNDLGVTFTDNYVLYKVLTEEGCKELSVLSQGYEPLTNYVEFREINIIRDSARIPVALDGVRAVPAPQHGIYWADSLKLVQLPRLRPGDGIEAVTFRKGFSYALLGSGAPPDERYVPPMPGQYFDIVRFEATVPIVCKKYVLKLPADKRLHSQVYNGPMFSSTTYTQDTTVYAWWAEDVKAWKPEDYRPDATDIVTKVVIATVESWEAKSRWFFDVNKNQFEVTGAIKAKVDEIFAEAGVTNGTEEEKAFELVHWVAQNIRYSGQTMGEGEGYTLHPGSMIFEQRSGVCKDIAGMLVTMMRAADMDSYAAMTMAGSRIEDVPADQFNHCVVALKKADGSYVMYDPTWVPFNKDIWSKFEAEQHYLIGSPEGEGLNRIVYSPAEDCPLRLTSSAKILADGTLEGRFEFEGEGTMDSRLRGLASWFRMSEVGDYLRGMLHNLSDRAELLAYRHGDVLDFHKAMRWEIDYRIPEYAQFIDSAYEFKSPVMRFTSDNRILFRPGAVEWSEERHDDVFFYTTQLLDAKETIKLPSGYEITGEKKSDKLDETYASCEGTAKMSGKALTISQRVAIKRRQIPPDGYEGFRKVMQEVKKFAGTSFRAEKGGAK
ncbi:MAG: DUF3857 domain-containing transglutaminase family protein [candidate division Zixibacteria bacterium]|nr:DUF3857 domain-containing transglutaminase family protein [candidate division Zixibacteria bacterium]